MLRKHDKFIIQTNRIKLNWESIKNELKFSTARSGGSGGQHVNKVETKVILYFNITTSQALTIEQKELLQTKLNKRLNSSGVLSMYSQATRSQMKNKERVIQNFIRLIKQSLIVPKKRIPTKMSKEIKAKILQHKKKRSATKALRKKPTLDS